MALRRRIIVIKGSINMEIELNTSELKEKAKTLRAGDKVLLSGTVYTSRDAAHKRIKACVENGEPLPYEIDGADLLRRTDPGEGRHGDRLLRPHHLQQNGRIFSHAA